MIFAAIGLIGLAAAVCILVSFLHLSFRFGRRQDFWANLTLGLCALMWCAGSISDATFKIGWFAPSPGLRLGLDAIERCGALAWMIPLLSLWRQHLRRRAAVVFVRVLQTVILLCAAFFLLVHLHAATRGGDAWLPSHELFRNSFLLSVPLLAVCLAILLGGRLTPADRFSLRLTFAGTACILGALLLLAHAPVAPKAAAVIGLVMGIAPLFILTGAVVQFARFRYADCFIRNNLRIVAATMLVTAICVLVFLCLPSSRELTQSVEERALRMLVFAAVTTVALLAFVILDQALNRIIERHIFPATTHPAVLEKLHTTLDHLDNDPALEAAVCQTARDTLDLADIAVLRLPHDQAEAWHRQITPGHHAKTSPGPALTAPPPLPDTEWLLPVQLERDFIRVLAIAPGRERRGLVTHEIDFLRDAALLLASRQEALRREQVLVAERQREAVLRQQLAEAELSALRAQINPHFLFNSLNTLANLVVTDPARAETMTLRLAQVFRHVLAHSARPHVTVREEMDFLRAYLHIEEARFGERLRVSFDTAPEIAAHPIPTLLLQPLVENALKHGLAPKPGAGHLWIAARAEAGWLRLCVEDDGMGLRHAERVPVPSPICGPAPDPTASRPRNVSTGTGLLNIRHRLETLYRQRSIFKLEPRAGGGCRAVICIPLGEEISA